jgi:hypothetical protein
MKVTREDPTVGPTGCGFPGPHIDLLILSSYYGRGQTNQLSVCPNCEIYVKIAITSLHINLSLSSIINTYTYKPCSDAVSNPTSC